MTKTVFCLSLPGGHMTYLALLVSVLLGKTKLKDDYFTPSGSSHGSDYLFPNHITNENRDENHIYLPITMPQWQEWYDRALQEYSRDGLCIFRAGWNLIPQTVWGNALRSLGSPAVLISSPNTKLDWIYCWFNMVDKVPKHVYNALHHRSRFYPKLWASDKLKILPKHVKIKEMSMAMPIYPVLENIEFDGSFRFSTTEILNDEFPESVAQYLTRHGLDPILDDELLNAHKKFVSMQMPNYERASMISKGLKLASRGPFDDVLIRFLVEQDPWN